MNNTQNQIGEFIKKQREKNKLSQNQLAELLYKDRTVISKWENDKLTPNIKDIISLSKIFNISVEELLSGKEITAKNKDEIHDNFNNYLITQNNRMKKLKKIIIILFVTILLVLIGFLIYYFYNSYKTTKIFRIYGNADNYKLNNGLLIITREKSYLNLGNITDNNGKTIKDITLYYLNKGKKKTIIYQGESDNVINDFTGYDSSINFGNIKELKNNLYISFTTNDDKQIKMKLELNQDFVNDNLLFKNTEQVSKEKISENKNIYNIPSKISKNFKCNDTMCEKKIEDFTLYYDIMGKMFYVQNDSEVIEYDTPNKSFMYYNTNNVNFMIQNNKLECYTEKCDNAKKIYNYYMKYIKKYI